MLHLSNMKIKLCPTKTVYHAIPHTVLNQCPFSKHMFAIIDKEEKNHQQQQAIFIVSAGQIIISYIFFMINCCLKFTSMSNTCLIDKDEIKWALVSYITN